MTLLQKVLLVVGGNERTQYATKMLDLIERFSRGDASVDLFEDRITETVTIKNVTIRTEWSLQYLIGEMAMIEGGEFEYLKQL